MLEVVTDQPRDLHLVLDHQDQPHVHSRSVTTERGEGKPGPRTSALCFRSLRLRSEVPDPRWDSLRSRPILRAGGGANPRTYRSGAWVRARGDPSHAHPSGDARTDLAPTGWC